MLKLFTIIYFFIPYICKSEYYYTNECQNDWFNYKNKKCVKVWNESKVNYTEALSKCQSMNASLGTIESEEENLFLTSLLYDLEPEVKGLYIGLKRKVKNDSYVNEFEWTANVDLIYENWAPGEPTPWFEPCVEMFSVDINAGKWNDVSCGALRYAVCQQIIYQNISNEFKTEFELCEHLDYVRYRNNCYKAYPHYSAQDWKVAQRKCHKDNASLLFIEDSYEHSFIKYWTKSALNNTYEFWIGLIARNNSQNLRYEWVNEWPVYYTAWESGQPKFLISTLDQCVVQDWRSGLWRSDPYCDDRRPFVCKISDHKPSINNTYSSAVCPHFNDTIKGQILDEWINLHKNLKHCYWFSDSLAMNWSEASKLCYKREGHLVSIHSRHESELLKPFVQKHNLPLWIGLYQSPGGFYRWDDGSDLDFQNWFPGEPSDEAKEICVEMRAQDMTWNDIQCSQRELNFICEIEKIQIIKRVIKMKDTTNHSLPKKVKKIKQNSVKSSDSIEPILWVIGVCLLVVIVLAIVSYIYFKTITEFLEESCNCSRFISTGFTQNNEGMNSQRSSVNDRNTFDISSIR